MSQTVGQLRAALNRSARARARFVRAKQLSEDGRTRAEVASILGLTDVGLRNMVYRETGSTCWPIKDPA